METEVRPEHSQKAISPILVTELGMVIEVRALHILKAISPMLVTEFGIVTEVRLGYQPLNAYSPILVTPSLIITFLMLEDAEFQG